MQPRSESSSTATSLGPLPQYPLAADVPGEASLVAERLQRDVEGQSHPSPLRDDIHEVGFGLEGDVELEELTGDLWVQGQNLSAELLEQRPPRRGQAMGMILDGEVCLRALVLKFCEDLGRQLRPCLDGERILCEPCGTFLDLIYVPGLKLPVALVQTQRTVLEAALHVALLGKRAIGVFRVIAGRGQVPEDVQVLQLNVLPVIAEDRLPLLREVLVLRHDVFIESGPTASLPRQ